MADLPTDKNYYDWHQKLISDGVLSRMVINYYDDCDSVYKARVNGKELTFPIGTHPQLLYPHFTMKGVSYTGEFEEHKNHDDDMIKRAAQQLANNKNGGPEVENPEDYIWNGEAYVVNSTNLDTHDSSLELQLTDSDFYTTVTKNQQLANELVEAILDSHLVGSTTIVEEDVFENDLPVRERYFDSVVDRFKNSGEFKEGIGGTYVTLIQSGDEYYLLTGQRTSDVYVWPDTYTVFPAGLLKPVDISTGNVLRDHLLSEYATEFYGLEDPTLASRAVSSLNQLLNSEDASFEITGTGVELVYGNFQVSGLLIIEYDDYIEFMQENSEKSFQHEDIALIKLSELDEVIDSFVHPLNITPTSGFALLNALTYIDEETDIEQPVDVDVKQYIPDQPARFESNSDGNVDLNTDW